jgi:formate dehydrogenase major subunit
MTNHWTDIANADAILVIGANPAENHPASFKHIERALDLGKKLIVVDPRFNRSAAKADIYAPMRSGGDIAFIGGLIKYVIDDIEKNPANYNLTYISEYTNAAYLLNPNFKGPADLNGLFSGYNEATRSYNKADWTYQFDDKNIPLKDKTLKDPNCVFQVMKKHFARYTPAKVEEISGMSLAKFNEIAPIFAATGRVGKAGTIMYAMGATQHTNGTQIIRAYGILQMLLANIGVAGGGINALRGESNVQGSTDYGILFGNLTGYLKQPIETDTSLAVFSGAPRAFTVATEPKSLNWWKNTPKYTTSLMKSFYGAAATKDNDFGFHWLPKNDTGVNYSWIPLFKNMHDGKIKGLTCFGMNPAVCGPNQTQTVQGLEKLEWLVVTELWETETANFWKRPGANPASIGTEVFLLPAACSYEKEGSVTNSSRWMQWRYKAVEPPGDAKDDNYILIRIMQELRKLYAAGGPNADAITKLDWPYNPEDPELPRKVAKEINGYNLTTGKLMANFVGLLDDGTTSCGNWLYSGSYVEPENLDAYEKAHPELFPAGYVGLRAARRDITDTHPLSILDAAGAPVKIGLNTYYGFAWPLNRRIIYNRASVDPDGKPWDTEHPVIKWDGAKWLGDVADNAAAPLSAAAGVLPFIMTHEGVGRLWGAGLSDGAFPEHYEPWESPVANAMNNNPLAQFDPTFRIWEGGLDIKGSPVDFPIICTTFRVVEHWQAGGLSRNLPWLVELMPSPYVEISEALASEKNIKNSDLVKVSSARGSIELAAMVTKRIKPFTLSGKTVHQVAMPWHWGWAGLSTGPSANVLSPNAGDANTMIPESKAFLVQVENTGRKADQAKITGRYKPIEPLVIRRGT